MEKRITPKEYDYFGRQRIIEALCREYTFIKKTVIGKSCGGKEITALKIGAAPQYSLIAAAFHGSERITSTVLLMFIQELCDAIKNDGYIAGLRASRAMRGRGVIFIPCVNPDGCDISLLGAKACGSCSAEISRLCKNNFTHWNANLRGVDINHNFDAGWQELRERERKEGIYGPSPTRFGGYKPESEPETTALTELCRTSYIRHVTALHTQGEVIYWSYGAKQPQRSRKMAEIMATSSGYALDVPTPIATGGGFKDWFIEEFSRPGFTIEMGLGENPLPAEDALKIYHRTREMLALITIM
ncbi:MAG: M14 family metallocarboxypeptidase [Clostridia bacterium]|nr:M14 family metallocarboxypeptidase [Clostridia bacterium]